MSPAAPPATRRLLKAALVIFVITVVIGILNGTDLWDVPRNTLLTHVHAGTLGWITLGVFAAAIWMFGTPDDRTANRLATYSIVALALYVIAFWSVGLTTTSAQRPVGGTLAFIAMTWMFVWALRRKRGTSWNVAEFGMILALGFLVIGAILGVLLGLQLADVDVVDPSKADRLSEAHPGAMVAGFVILAALALIEWLMPGRAIPGLKESRSGMIQMLLLFTAGLLFVAGSIFAVDPLLQGAGALQLIGSVFLVVRFRRDLALSRWGGPVVNRFVRTAVVGLLAAVVLVVYIISQISTGKTFEDILGVGLAFDHTNFIMVVTNLILAMLMLSSRVSDTANRIIYWSVNVGVVGFAVGLITESAPVKRVFTPILGFGLLYAIYIYLTAPAVQTADDVSVASAG
ncbi:MAG: hypothetical protein WCE80_14235 [Acidimicrobiia bacterium]